MMLLSVRGVGVLWEMGEDGKESPGISLANSSRMRWLRHPNCSSEAFQSTYIPRSRRNRNLVLHYPLEIHKGD